MADLGTNGARMLTRDFDYYLPPELIAQQPLPQRDRARMMTLDRKTGAIAHQTVRDLPQCLRPGDLMVVNDTRVIPARLFGTKAATGGRVEILLIEPLEGNRWHAWSKASGRARIGDQYRLASDRIAARIDQVAKDGSVILSVEVEQGSTLPDVLEAEGATPLPPYIKRPAPAVGQVVDDGAGARTDRQRYQTVYARAPGAVAAPTAGLHFTEALLESLEQHGIRRTALTLHVGPGTFKPVTADRIDEHVMDAERYEVPPSTARLIEQTRRARGRILAVGSTCVRVLEYVAAENQGHVPAGTGRVSLFIRPGFRFQVTDMMLTNFHLPRSTLLMMVSALAGRENILNAYREAVGARYRFYSYGDCMLIK